MNVKKSWPWILAVAAAASVSSLLVKGSPDGGTALRHNLDLPFDAGTGNEEEEEAPEILVFFGGVYEADGFFYCLDRSLSMSEGEWKTLQREVNRSIRELSDKAHFGLAFFSREVAAFPADRRPARATAKEKAMAASFVESLQPETWTCMLAGLRASLEMANRCGAARCAVILMSDGKPTCPGTDFVTYRKQILADARVLNAKGIRIHAIGIGNDVDDTLLEELAHGSGGSYRRLVR